MPGPRDETKPKLWYSPYDVGRIFGVSHMTARKWFKPGGPLYHDTQCISVESNELRAGALAVKELCQQRNVPVPAKLESDAVAYQVNFYGNDDSDEKLENSKR